MLDLLLERKKKHGLVFYIFFNFHWCTQKYLVKGLNWFEDIHDAYSHKHIHSMLYD